MELRIKESHLLMSTDSVDCGLWHWQESQEGLGPARPGQAFWLVEDDQAPGRTLHLLNPSLLSVYKY